MYKIDFYNNLDNTVYWEQNLGDSIFEKKPFLNANVISNQNIRYVFAEVVKNNELIAKLLIQIVPFEGSELKNYLSEDVSCLVKATIETVLEKVNWELAVIGNLFVSGDNGQYWKPQITESEKCEVLKQTSRLLRKTKEVDSVLISELNYEESLCSKGLENNGFKLFEIEPELYIDIPKKWKVFEDYLADMKSKYRVRTKKVLKDSAKLEMKNFSADDILENNIQIQKLYKNVTNKIGFKLAEVSQNYFYNLKLILKDDFTFTAYYLNGKMLGFINTINSNDLLEVHLIGLDYDINKSMSLYQRILYDCIKEAIEKNMNHINFGKTATTIKTTVGAKPKRAFGLLKHSNKVSNIGIKPFFKFLKPEPIESRNPFQEAI